MTTMLEKIPGNGGRRGYWLAGGRGLSAGEVNRKRSRRGDLRLVCCADVHDRTEWQTPREMEREVESEGGWNSVRTHTV
jgi:hypothetical protein